MKIRTTIPTNFGKEIEFHEENKVKFDSFGWTDVKENLGKELLMRYEGMFLTEEQVDASIKKEKIYEEKAVDAVILKIEDEKQKLELKLKEKESVITSKDEEIKVWKEKVDELLPKVEKAEFALKEEVEQNKKIVTDLKLRVQLAPKTVAQLKEVLVAMEVAESSYSKITKREDYIDLILEKSN